MTIITKKFENGLRFGFRAVSSPVAYLALSVKVGTRDEHPSLNGIAHMTEHMLFKGTTTRSSVSINNYLESLGGELNAYTTKEETVIQATVLKEDLSKAVELLCDLAFNSKFPEKELEKEKEVILEEIKSYKDSPSELIFDDFEEELFGGHPLAGNILGTPKSIKRITTKDIREFTSLNYRPENMSFSIVADLPVEKCEKLVRKYFEHTGKTANAAEVPAVQPMPPCVGGTVKIISKRSYQTHCVVGGRAYSFYDKRRLPLALLTNILGGPALNSRLNQVLREKHALAYTIDASYTPFTDTGVFSVYFGTDKSSLDKCISLVTKEFSLLKEKEISPGKLKAAKKQLLGQLAISMDNAEAQCLNIGKSLLVFNKVEPIGELRRKIEDITAHEIFEAANDIFSEDNLITLIYK